MIIEKAEGKIVNVVNEHIVRTYTTYECPACNGRGQHYEIDKYSHSRWPRCNECVGWGFTVKTTEQSLVEYRKQNRKRTRK